MVSNACAQFLCTENTLSSCTNFLPEQLNLEGQWEVAISEIFYPSLYQNVTEGKITLFDKKTFKIVRILLSGNTGLYHSIADIVETMNTLIEGRHSHSEFCMTVKVSRRTQKVEIYLLSCK